MCHPNHPWNKWERFQMLVLSLAISIVPSAMIGKEYGDEPVTEKILITFFVTIPNVIFGVFLYQLAIAETRACPCCPLCLKQCFVSCCGQIQSCCLCIVTVF